jgi:hypothetical protein
MQPGIVVRCPSRACVPTLVVRVGLLHSIARLSKVPCMSMQAGLESETFLGRLVLA